MSIHAHTLPSRKETALEFLKSENDNYQERRARRIRFARLAKDSGFTNQEIGDAYGITEAAIRAMLKRSA